LLARHAKEPVDGAGSGVNTIAVEALAMKRADGEEHCVIW
jgi:hypothetical protein